MEDQIALLRKLSSQQDIRKKLIGGFSEEDVTAYVNNIYDHFQQIESGYQQNLENLQTANSELRNEFDAHKLLSGEQIAGLEQALKANEKEINSLTNEKQQYLAQRDELASQLSILEQEIEQLRANVEELKNEKYEYVTQITSLKNENSSIQIKLDNSFRACEELERQLESHHATDKDMDSLMQNVIELEDALKEYQDKLQEAQKIKVEADKYYENINILETKVNELEEQLQVNKKMTEEQEQQLKNEHETIVRALEVKLKQKNDANTINNIHAVLDQLKDQVTVIDNLQQQLGNEQIRAEKAEKEMSQFYRWVSVLKERFHNDQYELEAQFTQIEEKYKSMYANVNGLRTNMENFCLVTGMEIDEFYSTVSMYDLIDDKHEEEIADE